MTTGARFAWYEPIAQIGAGGMGEVYESRDTKLGRNVAINVLPEGFTPCLRFRHTLRAFCKS